MRFYDVVCVCFSLSQDTLTTAAACTADTTEGATDLMISIYRNHAYE